MTCRFLLSICAVSLLVHFPEPIQAGILAYHATTGSGYSLNVLGVRAYGDVLSETPLDKAYSASGYILSPFGPAVVAQTNISSTAFAKASYGNLHLTAAMHVEGDVIVDELQMVHATAEWQDILQIRWVGIGPAPALPTTLFATVTGTGSISFDSDGVDHFYSLRSGTLDIVVGAEQQLYAYSVVDGPTIAIDLSIQVPLRISSADGTSYVNYSARTEVQAAFGITLMDLGHTISLTSILMPDGTTPESHGWQLVFDSGMPSPNSGEIPTSSAASVPEPNSLIILLVGLACTGLPTARRKSGFFTTSDVPRMPPSAPGISRRPIAG